MSMVAVMPERAQVFAYRADANGVWLSGSDWLGQIRTAMRKAHYHRIGLDELYETTLRWVERAEQGKS